MRVAIREIMLFRPQPYEHHDNDFKNIFISTNKTIAYWSLYTRIGLYTHSFMSEILVKYIKQVSFIQAGFI